MLLYIYLIVGFFLLIKGADLLVDGASSLARRFGISPLVVGLTIVSFGTSAPELIVNLVASVNGNGDIAIGNVIGSNTANILLILGCSSVVYPLAVKFSTVWKEIPLALLASLLVGVMASDALLNSPVVSSLNGDIFSGLSRIDGVVFLSFFIIFMYYTFGISKTEASDDEETTQEIYPTKTSLFMIVAGLFALVLGGDWVVGGATDIARDFGISEALIGLTMVALGTSLPELATSVVAAYKKDVDIAVGNVVGSNIFNVFLVLGTSSLVSPLRFSDALLWDTVFSMFATLLLFSFIFIGKKGVIERRQGVFFVLIYFLYIAILFVRG